jgi:hypothetical protein
VPSASYLGRTLELENYVQDKHCVAKPHNCFRTCNRTIATPKNSPAYPLAPMHIVTSPIDLGPWAGSLLKQRRKDRFRLQISKFVSFETKCIGIASHGVVGNMVFIVNFHPGSSHEPPFP